MTKDRKKIGLRPYLSDKPPNIIEPSMTPTMNNESPVALSHALSQTKFHCGRNFSFVRQRPLRSLRSGDTREIHFPYPLLDNSLIILLCMLNLFSLSLSLSLHPTEFLLENCSNIMLEYNARFLFEPVQFSRQSSRKRMKRKSILQRGHTKQATIILYLRSGCTFIYGCVVYILLTTIDPTGIGAIPNDRIVHGADNVTTQTLGPPLKFEIPRIARI